MNNNSNTRIATLTGLLATFFTMTSHSAADYRYEVDASYGDRSGSFSDLRSRSLSARYFFSAVDDSQGPLALASFIDRASSLTLFATDSEVKFDALGGVLRRVMLSPDALVPVLDNDYDIITPSFGVSALPIAFSPPKLTSDSFGATIEYISDSAWIVRGDVTAEEAGTDQPFTAQNEDGVAFALGIGRYVGDLFTVTLSYRYADLDAEFTALNFSCPPSAACTTERFTFQTNKIRDRSWSLASRYVLPLGDVSHEFTALADYGVRTVDTGAIQAMFPIPIILLSGQQLRLDRWQLAGGYAYHPRNDLSIGVNFSHLDLEGEDRQTFALGGKWFVNPALALEASLVRSNVDADSFAIGLESNDGFEVAVTGRF